MDKITAQELYAQLYDVRVPDWQGEVDFYRELIAHSHSNANRVLEVACGTGRITLQLAKDGVDITGLDISSELLDIARAKSVGMPNVNWILGDMRTFEIGTKFGCVILPGHSFQFMNTPDDQVKCLEQIKRHLLPNGLVVIHLDHQDFVWLAGLLNKKEPVYEKSRILTHPITNQKFRQSFAWTFEPSTQTATIQTNWEEINENGEVIQIWEMERMRLHCAFRFEMEHLLKRVGFSIEAVYGDFFKSELTNESGQMIWLARNKVS
jgi:ubiquinone/menaquinone biosynthesis C-methylase UbiE